MVTAATTTEVDGVDVHWRPVAGRLRASLVFRVGVVDEEFHTLGTGHLVEHLAFAEAEDLDPDVNGISGVQTTHFQMEGSPEKVVRQLSAVCRALSDLADGSLPAGLIEHEKRILAAEGGVVALPDPAMAEALTLRYGLRGPGLAGVTSLFGDRISGEETRDFARSHFTRGNATLVLTGEPPAGLHLPLPAGERVAVPEHLPVPLDLPGEYTSGGEDLVLSFHVPGTHAGTDPVARLVLTALRRRSYRRLRRDAGVLYDVDAGLALQPRSGLAVVTVRTAGASVPAAAEGVLGILRELRDHGVEAADREALLQELQDQRDEPDAGADDILEQGEAALLGEPRLAGDALAEAVRAVRADDVRDWLAQLEATLAVGVPAGAYAEEPEPGTAGLVATVMGPVDGPEVTGTVHPVRLLARFGGVPRGMRLVVGEHGLMLTDGTSRRSLTWDRVAAVERDSSDPDVPQVNVIGADGEVIEVIPAVFRGGDRAVEQILARVPERRWATTDLPDGGDGHR